MSRESRKISLMLWAGVALLMATLLLTLFLAQLRYRASLGPPLDDLGPVADFSLTNQDGQAVSLADLRGHVWVADIIFTRCVGPCLKMTRHMKELQQALPPKSDAKLVTLTTDPDFDTPSVLKKRAEQVGAAPQRWMFLTGSKKEIGILAANSLKLTAIEKKPEEREDSNDLFIHSTIFVVVDRHAHLRGVFQTTGEGIDAGQAKTAILGSVRRLEHER
jgi:cytochrome oxidase Cu insertion factor (SCO1/SenC/PrrC family)